jgi:hypothetical protein
MARVYFDHAHPTFLCLVGQETMELCKAPTMQASFGLQLLAGTTSDLGGTTNVGQVLKHNGTARASMLNNAFRKDMVAVPVKSQSLPAQLLQVAFGRLCSFGLKFSLEAEAAAVHFFPVTVSQEVTVGGHSRSVQTQVYTDHLISSGDVRVRQRDNDMQPILSVAGAQVSSNGLTSCVLGAVGGTLKGMLTRPLTVARLTVCSCQLSVYVRSL